MCEHDFRRFGIMCHRYYWHAECSQACQAAPTRSARSQAHPNARGGFMKNDRWLSIALAITAVVSSPLLAQRGGGGGLGLGRATGGVTGGVNGGMTGAASGTVNGAASEASS